MSHIRFYGTGRRKESSARVWITPGSGIIKVNDQMLDIRFKRETLRMVVRSPFTITALDNKFNVKASVKGGGLSGQAGALKHGISRALSQLGRDGVKETLKKAGYLTRDSRMVERKKYGQAGARKRFQYSKR